MSQSIREIDPNDLRLPPSRASGADPLEAAPTDPAVRIIEGRDAADLRLRGFGWGSRNL
jgi:hypothetical protein